MRGLLVVTHGRFAEELVAAAARIVGNLEGVEAVAIDWDDDVDRAREMVEQGIRNLDKGDGVLILTDMFGGTPTNIALSLLEPGRVEIVTGVNLPMLIKFTNIRGRLELHESAARIAEQGRSSIHVATTILERRAGDPVDAGDEGGQP
jgi:PTS system mannose-specific IIA component